MSASYLSYLNHQSTIEMDVFIRHIFLIANRPKIIQLNHENILVFSYMNSYYNFNYFMYICIIYIINYSRRCDNAKEHINTI